MNCKGAESYILSSYFLLKIKGKCSKQILLNIVTELILSPKLMLQALTKYKNVKINDKKQIKYFDSHNTQNDISLQF